MVKFCSTVCLLSVVAMSLSLASAPQSRRRLWVLETARVVEYDPSNWAVVNSVPVPAEFINDPDNLQINRSGQMLFCSDPDIQFGNPERHFPPDKVWLWNGRTAVVFDIGPSRRSGPDGGRNITIESSRRWALSSDGRKLFCFENEFSTVKDANGADKSVSTTFRVWETDLNGGRRVQIASFAFPPCDCGTGVCSETCPEAGIWLPREGVGEFFFMSRWIPGQLDAAYQSTFVYRRSAGKWLPQELPKALEDIQDAAQAGKMIVHRILDPGCCGWENGGNDQTVLTGSGRDIVLFDELRRYGNQDYDVSFFTSNARISPDAAWVAVTIASTPVTENGFRLSDGGKANPDELAHIRRSVAGLPVVEVLGAGDPSRRAIALAHATFAGWLNAREILVIENGSLVALDIDSHARRTTPIKAASESLVFLR